jgi:phosphoesterase RecJ-like protein
MSIDWTRFAELIRQHQRFLLTSHIRPDCDALGSELGMAALLEALGKEVLIVNGQSSPANLAFIDPDRRIKAIQFDVQPSELGRFDAWMILDTSAWAQLGPMADLIRNSKAKKIVLDHHVGEDDLGAEFFKDSTAEATGRLVYEAAQKLKVKLTPAIAQVLLAAIATDTGWFRFSSITSLTYRVAAELIDAGAQPTKLYQEIYERDTLGRARLRGLVLCRMQLELNGRLAHTWIVQRDFAETGATPGDTEDLINQLMSVQGVEAALIFVETIQGAIKISFRSKGALDCNELARTFGGGGHKAAAGATLPAPLEAARASVVAAATKRMA